MSLKSRIIHHSALLTGCALLPASSFAQVSFESQQIAKAPSGFYVHGHGDFNNDGREDLGTIIPVPFSPVYGFATISLRPSLFRSAAKANWS
jgi:hypothetical protein